MSNCRFFAPLITISLMGCQVAAPAVPTTPAASAAPVVAPTSAPVAEAPSAAPATPAGPIALAPVKPPSGATTAPTTPLLGGALVNGTCRSRFNLLARSRGHVKYYNDVQGIGSITPIDGSRDATVVREQLRGVTTLVDGQEVEFDYVLGEVINGVPGPVAKNVTVYCN